MKSLVKACSVAAVLALAALMPDFHLLKTSPEGLALIANLEGCRLRPYQCSAGVWTSGIGHTAGVAPQREITERQAAADLVNDVLTVERRLADALVSFSFNVGTGAVCRSTMVSYLKRHQWYQACDQLPRWVFINGVRSDGLDNRRQRERTYCMKGAQ